MKTVIIRLTNGVVQEILSDTDCKVVFIESDTSDMPDKTISHIDGEDCFLYTKDITESGDSVRSTLLQHESSLKKKKMRSIWSDK